MRSLPSLARNDGGERGEVEASVAQERRSPTETRPNMSQHDSSTRIYSSLSSGDTALLRLTVITISLSLWLSLAILTALSLSVHWYLSLFCFVLLLALSLSPSLPLPDYITTAHLRGQKACVFWRIMGRDFF